MQNAHGLEGTKQRKVGQAFTRKSLLNQSILITALIAVLSTFVDPLYANPTGGVVSSGSATISQVSGVAGQLQVNQTSEKAVINWQSFNINSHETTRFVQPGAGAIALNRVNPNNGGSAIFGNLTANGNVWIINPAGVLFGPSAHVDVAGLLATTANISDQDFMSGNYHFIQDPAWAGAVINQGTIRAVDGGLVALVAPGVANSGVIQARLGKVALAAGNEFTVDLYGDQLINFGVNAQVQKPAHDADGNVMKDAVSNSGKIIADGGSVLLSAQVAKGVVDNAINMSGYIKARSAYNQGGSVVLLGGDQGIVRVSGHINVSGKHPGQQGGKVIITGEKTGLFAGATIDASGDAGGGQVFIGGGAHGQDSSIPNAQYTYIDPAAVIKADALQTGNGGHVVVWGDQQTQFYGSIYARGGAQSGNGGFVETSGYTLFASGKVNTLAPNGAIGNWLLDPHNINVVTGGGSSLPAVAAFGTTPSADATIDPSTINAASSNVTLQANNDITFTNDISITTAGVTLTAQAGRSLIINANITTNNAAINLTANETTANGVVNANRDSGTAAITMAASKTITSGGAAITITLSTGAGLTNSTSGNISLEKVNATGGNVSVVNNGPTAGSSIVRTDSSELITAGAVSLDVNGAGAGGGIGAGGSPIIVSTTNLNARSQSQGVFISSPSHDINLGGATFAGLTGVSTSSGGLINVASTSNSITTSQAVSTTANGGISFNAGNVITVGSGGSLTAGGSGGITFTATNSITLNDSLSSSTGSILLNSIGGTLSVASGKSVSTSVSSGSGTISIFANDVSLAGGGTNLNDPNATITIVANTVGPGLSVGLGNAGSNLSLSGAEIQAITTPTLSISSGTNGSITVDGLTATNTANITTLQLGIAGSGVTFSGGNSSFTNLTVNSNNLINVNTGITTTGTMSLHALTTLTENSSTGAISANTLSASGSTVSLAPTNAANNTVTNFSSNSNSLNFVNTASTLTITSLSVSSGSATVNNTGNVTVSGNISNSSSGNSVSVTAAGGTSALTVNNGIAISTTGGGGIALTAADINLAGGGSANFANLSTTGNTTITSSRGISFGASVASTLNLDASELQHITSGTLNLTAAAGTNITIDTISATNSANISGLTTLTASGSGTISFANGASTFNNSLTANSATGAISVGANLNSSNNITLSSSGSSISEANSAIINAALLTTSSSTGTTLNDSNTVTTFNATNTSSGDIAFTNSATTLTLSGIAETGGNVNIANTGNITVSGNAADNTSNGTATFTVSGGNTFTVNNAIAVSTIGASGNISISANDIVLNGGGTASFANISSGGNTTITSGRGVSLGTAVASTLALDAAELQHITASSLTLTAAVDNNLTVNNVGSANSANISGLVTLNTLGTGNVLFATNPSTFLSTLRANSAATVNLGSGADVTDTNGDISLSGATGVSLGSNVSAASHSVYLEAASGTVSQSAGVITASNLLVSSQGTASLTQNNTASNLAVQITGSGNGFAYTGTGSIVAASLTDTNAPITVNGISTTGGGAITLNSASTFSQTAPISGGTLTATAVGGITLNTQANTITGFNVTNTSSGNIALSNTASTLTVSGVSQTGGGNITITNAGNVTASGNITNNTSGGSASVTATGGTVTVNNGQSISTLGAGSVSLSAADLALAGTLSSGGATTITSSRDIILGNTVGTAMTISPSELQNMTVGGNLTLNAGSGFNMTVDSISATNSANITGTTILTTTGGGTLSFSTSPSTFAHALTANASGAISVGASVVTNSGNISLSSTGGSITESNGATITTPATLTTSSVGGTLLTNKNSASSFNATNSGSGNITFIDPSPTLTVTGVSQSSGDVTITNAGDIVVSGNILDTANNATINLTATNSNLTINNGISVTASGTSGAIAISATSLSLGGGGSANFANLNSAGNTTITASGSIGLGNTAGTMTITSSQLQNITAGSLTLAGGGTVTVDNISAANSANIAGTTFINNSGSGGAILFQNNPSTFTNSLSASTLGSNITIGANLTVNNGSLSFSKPGGGLLSETGGAIITAPSLTVSSLIGGINFANTNVVPSINLSNSVVGNITFNDNTPTLTITGITQSGSGTSLAITNAGNITATGNITNNVTNGTTSLSANNSGTLTVNNGIAVTTTGSSSNIAIAATDLALGGGGTANFANLNSPGAVNITAAGSIGVGATSGAMTISASELQNITATNLTLTAGSATNIKVSAISAANSANISGTTTFNTTGGGTLLFFNGPSFFANVTANTSGKIDIQDELHITNALNLTSGGTILANNTNNIYITANSLTTSSVGGTNLSPASPTQNSQVNSFNATNTGSGDISFISDNANPLTITGISQAGGGAISIVNLGDITTSGAITSDGGAVIVIANYDSGHVSNNSGTITVNNPITVNGAGNITLQAVGNLASNSATSDLILNASLSSTSGNINLNSDRNITFVNGGASVAANKTITLVANKHGQGNNGASNPNSGAISETGTGIITAGFLNETSAGGSTLTGLSLTNANAISVLIGDNTHIAQITNTIPITIQKGSGSFGFQNSGTFTLTNTGTVTVSTGGIFNIAGDVNITANGASSDVTTSDVVRSTSGNIAITAGRNITINGAGNQAGYIAQNGNVTLNASNGSISDTASGDTVSATTLTTTSKTGTTLSQGTSLTNFNATNTTSGDIVLNNTSGALNITGISQQAASGNINITAQGAITQSGGNIISNGVGTTATFSAIDNSSNLYDITLNTASNDFATVIIPNANNVSLTDVNSLALGNATISGNLIATAGGTLTVANGNAVNVASPGATIAITASDLALGGGGSANFANLNSGGNTSITSTGSLGLGATAGAMTISAAELQHITADSLTLTTSNNGDLTVDNVAAVNSGNIGSGLITLNASGTGSVLFANNSSNFTSLTATAGNAVNVAIPLTVTNALNVTGGNLVTIAATVNAGSLTTGSTGTTQLSSDITTTGNTMTFNNPVTLLHAVALTDNGTSGIFFNKTVNGNFNLNLTAVLGSIQFADFVGTVQRLGQVVVSNVNTLTALHTFNAAFLQSQGSGATSFSALNTTGDIAINADSIAGSYTGNQINLNGVNGINGVTVHAQSLTFNGLSGGSGFGTVAGLSGHAAAALVQLASGAQGQFFFNGCLLPSGCTSTNPGNDSGNTNNTDSLGTVVASDDLNALLEAVQPQVIFPENAQTLIPPSNTTSDVCVSVAENASSATKTASSQHCVSITIDKRLLNQTSPPNGSMINERVVINN